MARRCYLLLLFTTFLSAADPARVDQLRIRILSTMLADARGVGEWGFSPVVETPRKRILFDTGARPETVLSQMDDVVLSHNHADHTGGLVTLRRELMKRRAGALARARVGDGIFESRPSVRGVDGPEGPYTGPEGLERNRMLVFRPQYESLGGTFIVIDKPREIAPGVWLTGPVARQYPERNYPEGSKRKTAAGLAVDTVREDMSLVVDTSRGRVVLTDCAHAGIINTIAYAREKIRDAPVYAVIGGMHLFQASDKQLDWTAGRLRTFGVQQFLGAHCTGIEHHLFAPAARTQLNDSAGRSCRGDLRPAARNQRERQQIRNAPPSRKRRPLECCSQGVAHRRFKEHGRLVAHRHIRQQPLARVCSAAPLARDLQPESGRLPGSTRGRAARHLDGPAAMSAQQMADANNSYPQPRRQQQEG